MSALPFAIVLSAQTVAHRGGARHGL